MMVKFADLLRRLDAWWNPPRLLLEEKSLRQAIAAHSNFMALALHSLPSRKSVLHDLRNSFYDPELADQIMTEFKIK